MKIKLIYNPTANGGRAGKQLAHVRNVLDRYHIDYDITLTTHAQHAIAAAQEAEASGFDAVIAAGGDGTINEVVNGLLAATGDDPATIPLGILPIGTGNDLSDMLGLPRDIDQIARSLAAGKTCRIDVGRVAHGGGVYFFDNNSALAMEALVTAESLRVKVVGGVARYVLATLRALRRLRAWQMDIGWSEGRYQGPVYLLSICNGRRTGSTFMMAPNAEFDDGLFDVVLIPEVPWRTVLRLLPRLIRGTHLSHPDVISFRTDRLTVHSEPSTPIHADGEMVALAANEIQYQMLPQRLTLLMER